VTTVSVTAADPTTLDVDTLVIGITPGPDRRPRLLPGAEPLDQAFSGRLAATIADLGGTGDEDDATRFATLGATTAPNVLAVGVGDAADVSPTERLRRAAGTAMRALAGRPSAALLLATTTADVGAVAEGALFGSYRFDRYRGRGVGHGQEREPLDSVTLVAPDADQAGSERAIARAQALSRGVHLCRDLVNTPAIDLHPAQFAEAAAAAGRAAGVTVQVMAEDELAEAGFGGILGVGAGAANPPRLVRMEYRPDGAGRSVALVGKGVTFDSGGLSLKPKESMETMKSDMSGAAAVIAAVTVAAELELPVSVIGWAPMSENLVGGGSIRPGDVLRMYGGRTVEVQDTDAEGRLLLGDAIARACEEKPAAVLDIATLTGAQVIALGDRMMGVLGTDDGLRERVVAAATDAGEPAWGMPMPEYLVEHLRSPIADMKNIGMRGNGGMLVAGLFLREFVADGVPWAHLDIAGPAFNSGSAWGYTPKGGTGYGVRTFIRFLEEFGAPDSR
jgi:leucyl aminopeptidase